MALSFLLLLPPSPHPLFLIFSFGHLFFDIKLLLTSGSKLVSYNGLKPFFFPPVLTLIVDLLWVLYFLFQDGLSSLLDSKVQYITDSNSFNTWRMGNLMILKEKNNAFLHRKQVSEHEVKISITSWRYHFT